MKAIKPLRLSFLHRTFDHDRKHHFVATVLVGFDLQDPKKLIPEVDLWKMIGTTLGKFTVFDHCMWKPNSEVLVSGDAFPPGGVPATECSVGLRVMRDKTKLVDRTLRVVGDRTWGAIGPSEPTPFDRMPVDWEHAFGGEKSDWNLAGKGLAPLELPGGEKIHPLANIEDPARPVTSKLDRPKPACFGPVDITLPVHFKKMGTYDKRWKDEFFLGLAEDIDWSVFNVAHEDQRLAGWLSGTETFRVANMNRDVSVIEGSLPQIVARCLLKERGKEGLEELPLRLETLHLFPTSMRGVLIFRGFRTIGTQDATDIEIGVAALEMKGAEPRSIAHYERVMEQRLDRVKGYLHLLRDSDLLPPELGLAVTSTETDRITEVVKSENLGMRNARARMQWELDKAKAKLREMGIDARHFEHVELPAEEELPGSVEDMPAFAERTEKRMQEAKEAAYKEKEEAEARLREACRAHGLDFDALVEQAKSRAGIGPPKFTAEGEVKRLRDLYVQSLASGVPLQHVEDQLDDPELRKKLLVAEQQLHDAYVRAGHFQSPVAPLVESESERARAELLALVRAGEPVSRRDFSGADLAKIDLTGADLSGIYLEGANLEGARLVGANLSRAVLSHARLEGAVVDGADLSGANLGRVKATKCSFKNVSLEEAVLYEADLRGASLDGADLKGAQILEVKLDGADLRRTKAERLFFVKTSFKGVDFAGCALVECAFVEADLTGASFVKASVKKTAFIATKGDDVKFDDAELDNLRVVHECSFNRATFVRSKMQMSNFRATPLVGASFESADVSRSVFTDCDMTGANLYRAVAVEAHFTNANLTNARLTSANLLQSILRGTILRGADGRGANLFGADMSGAIGDDRTSFSGALVKRVVTTKGGARASE
ncbi:MAG: DUF2169 domain-containing protein [Polyangiaceae bacterium]